MDDSLIEGLETAVQQQPELDEARALMSGSGSMTEQLVHARPRR